MLTRLLMAKALVLLLPWLDQKEVNRHSADIAETVGDDVVGGFMLVATGAVETGFRERFTRCECKKNECDNGEALGVYQLRWYWWSRFTKEEICSSNGLSTALAYRVLSSLRKRGGEKFALMWYVGMNVKEEDARIVPRLMAFNKLVSELEH